LLPQPGERLLSRLGVGRRKLMSQAAGRTRRREQVVCKCELTPIFDARYALVDLSAVDVRGREAVRQRHQEGGSFVERVRHCERSMAIWSGRKGEFRAIPDTHALRLKAIVVPVQGSSSGQCEPRLPRCLVEPHLDTFRLHVIVPVAPVLLLYLSTC